MTLDPYAVPSPAAKGFAKQASGQECANADCIPTVLVKVGSTLTDVVNEVSVVREDTGEEIPHGVEVAIPVGTKLTLKAEADSGQKYGFSAWSATDTLAGGSRETEEEIYLAPRPEDRRGDVDDSPFRIYGVFARNSVVVPKDSQYRSYSVSNGLFGGTVDDDSKNLFSRLVSTWKTER